MSDDIIIVAQVSFPRESLNQAVKAYVGLEDLPAGIDRTGPYFKTESGQVRAITFYRFSPTDQGECLEFVEGRYKSFDGIAGFSRNIDRWQSFDSAIGRFLA